MKNWIPRALLVALLASACQAGVFTQMGDHPNTDVQLPSSQFLNFTLSSATLDREFPQYNYAEQGDLVGYFEYNPAELVIWAPRANNQLDQDPPVGALLQLTAPLLDQLQPPGWQSSPPPETTQQDPTLVVTAPPVNYHPTTEQKPPVDQPPSHPPAGPPTVIPPVILPNPPVDVIPVHTGTVTDPQSSAVPEPSLSLLVGSAIALMTAMRSAKLLRRR